MTQERNGAWSTHTFDLAIVGGIGHVGLPLGLVLAEQGLRVCLYDTNAEGLKVVQSGQMPFLENGAEPILKRVLGRTLFLSSDVRYLERARMVLVTIGTPVDEYFNPRLRGLLELFDYLAPHLNPTQTIIIRSTVYPGTCQQIARTLDKHATGPWKIAYCPERTIEGHAIEELHTLPQLVAGLTDDAIEEAEELFSPITSRVIRVSMREAELAKLFTNAWRYIQFAVANQFYMIAHQFDADFTHVREAMVEGYGRAGSLPSAGFAAGPCLLKDTMQLAASYGGNFMLGHTAMLVNEGLPKFLVDDLAHRYDLSSTHVGILGMAFKADIDDTRDSLSYKLGKILRFHGAQVSCSDEFVQDPTFISKEELVATCDVIVIGVPHSKYRELEVPNRVELIDLWGAVTRRSVLAAPLA